MTTVEKAVNFLPETRKEIIYVQDKPNKINCSEADEVKETQRLCFSESKGFQIMCEISYVLMREDVLGSEDLDGFLSVSGIVCY